MHLIVDTNVPIVANQHQSPQASPLCILACIDKLREIQIEHILVLDNNREIIREYIRNLHSSGQPGVGNAFLKWVLTNQANPLRCELVELELDDQGEYINFPKAEALAHFDLSDRKFVAVALTHLAHPPILNAVDTDWWHHRQVLAEQGVQVDFLCPEEMLKR
jgi:hypothetical protein